MKTVAFGVKTPCNNIECVLSKAKLCSIDNTQFDDAGANTIHKAVRPSQVTYLIKELGLLNRFRNRVYCFLRSLKTVLVFDIVEPKNGNLVDHAWCRRALRLTWEKVEIENLMSWLSTLGGAFSALGDSFEQCSDRAGRISMYQLKLGMRSGDPSIITRCKLYYSISLIQKWKLRAAKKLIRKKYEYAKREKEAGDDRLYKMCHGIWLKLQYSYVIRRQKRLQINHG